MESKEIVLSRIYTVTYSGTLTAAGGDADLFELLPASNKPIRLRGLILSQSTEEGDTQEEGLRISIIRLPATVTDSNGGSVTPNPLDESDVAAGFTCKANGATIATTSGTAVILDDFAWNERITPMERWWPDPQFAPMVRQAGALVVRNQTTAADDISIVITAYVEEY